MLAPNLIGTQSPVGTEVGPDVVSVNGFIAQQISTISNLIWNADTEEEDVGEAEDEEPTDAQESPTPPTPAEHLYRIKVALQWKPTVWRVIEMLDNQTLYDLHEAIQDAFGWGHDHLYAFYLSGIAWDSLTEVNAAPMWDDLTGPPYADEVYLRDLELKPQQRILYIFDFGDDLRHDVTVLKVLPPAYQDQDDFPRIVEKHGEAPPQYPSYDGDDQEDEEEEEDDEDEENDEPEEDV